MSSKPKGKNDHAWEKLFNKYDILNQIDMHEKFIISANQIKEFREPRLMAKFDHNINLPQIFSENRLAILFRIGGKKQRRVKSDVSINF